MASPSTYLHHCSLCDQIKALAAKVEVEDHWRGSVLGGLAQQVQWVEGPYKPPKPPRELAAGLTAFVLPDDVHERTGTMSRK